MSDTSLSSEDEGELLYSDEDQPHPPGYGATHSRAPYLQHVATNTGNAGTVCVCVLALMSVF